MTTPMQRHAQGPTPADRAILGRDAEMAPNHGGGVAFLAGDWTQFQRFLILGTEGQTYYCTEKEQTLENVGVVARVAKEDGRRALRMAVDVTQAGRAMKKAPAIWTVAWLLKNHADVEVRREAAAAVPLVCNIGTDILMLVSMLKGFRHGFSRLTKKAIESWYTKRDPAALAFQLMKYQSREKFAHRDVLRLLRPSGHERNGEFDRVLRWATKGWEGSTDIPAPTDAMRILWAFERAKVADEKETISLIRDHRLPREGVRTEMLNSPAVWDALLDDMGATALVRNLGKMSAVGLLTPLSDAERRVSAKLSDESYVVKAKLHPLRTLLAIGTYAQGHGEKGGLTWKPVPQVGAALDTAFYNGFKGLVPTGKKHLLALDVSGSMGGRLSGHPLTCAQATAALAMVRARVESSYYVMGFTHNFIDLGIHGKMTLQQATGQTLRSDFGRTDISLPMRWALQNKIPVDVVEVYTDNELNTGMQPTHALDAYRHGMGRDVHQVVCAMTATRFTVADPADPKQLDVVGFDAALPEIVNAFLDA